MSILNGDGFTRRRFALGTAAAGAAAALASTLGGCGGDGKKKQSSGEPQVVDDDSQVIDVLEDFKSGDMGLAAAQTWTLPLGTVLFHSEGSWSAAMLAPEDALHVNALGALSLSSGSLVTLRQDPELGRGYSFFDVRCGTGVSAWVEIDYSTLNWVLLAQPFSDGSLSGSPVRLDDGDKDWEPPMFSTTGSSVVWQRMPLATGDKSSSDSHCYIWSLGDGKGTEVYTSTGRFATHPRISDGILTIAPRVLNDKGTYYGMTALSLDGGSFTKLDQLVLPSGVRPFEAVYTGEEFVFSIEASYDSVGVLGNMGTFVGREGGPYTYFGREPAAQTCFANGRYFIKTQSAHYVVDPANSALGAISSPARSLDFGDYPASEGRVSQFVTYATVRDGQGIPTNVTARVFSV